LGTNIIMKRFKKVWIVGNNEFTNKRAAYRHCRTINGKKAGGNRNFNVQRKMAS
jgi:hypothetical protein